MKLNEFQNAFRKVRTVAVISCSKARTLEKTVESICSVLALFIAAKITGNLGLFMGFFNQHARPFIYTMLVSIIFYSLLLVIADIGLAFFRELFGWNSSGPKSPDPIN